MTDYSSDRPLGSSKDDLFSRKGFALKIAEQLKSHSIDESYVIGLYSAWGSGKTSVINMIVEKLDEDAIVVEFNPWLYSTQKAMVKGLLAEIAAKIDDAVPTDSKVVKYTRNIPKVGDWVQKRTAHGTISVRDSLKEILSDYAEVTGIVNETAGKGAVALSNLLTKTSQEKIRHEVEARIKESGKRVIVIIDDVDRLEEAEVFELFKLIKVVTDFKGVTYLVSFDDVQVSKALNARFAGGEDPNSGRRYIEKIIQVPLNLPAIDRYTLNQLFIQQVEEVLAENDISVPNDEAEIFASIYTESISNTIKTPRNMNRYINSIKFTLPMVKNEVNAVDHLILESIRIFYPEVYERMIGEKALLTGSTGNYFVDREAWKKEAITRYEAITGENKELHPIMKSLFPAIKKLYEQSTDFQTEEDYRRKKFIASPDYFDRYFSLGVGSIDVADSEIIEILELDSAKDIASRLATLFQSKNQELILTKIDTYKERASSSEELSAALLSVSDDISSSKPGIFRETPLSTTINLIVRIIKDSDSKVKIATRLLGECNNLEALAYLVRDITLYSNPQEGKDIVMNEDELSQFKAAVIKRIKAITKKRILHEKPDGVGHILYQYWAEFSSREEVNQYLLGKLTNTDKILDFLTPYLATWTGGNGSHRGDLNKSTYDYVMQVVDLPKLYAIAKAENPDTVVEEMPPLERDSGDVSRAGNEGTQQFRDILLRQFIYYSEHLDISA